MIKRTQYIKPIYSPYVDVNKQPDSTKPTIPVYSQPKQSIKTYSVSNSYDMRKVRKYV